jgi:hypothetical protein
MRKAVAIRSFLFSLVCLAFSHGSFGQIAISVSFGPPALPVYEQPICPEEGYIWTPGFWAYDDDDGYYWVPGTWVLAPEPGFLWTPGYWGWSDEGVFIFHEGYWGEHVGFYGGVSYGYGYFGRGYDGGRWDNGHFYYNTYVNRVNTTIIHNTYNTTIVENNATRVSYNGGSGGIQARPTPQEEAFSRERHVAPLAAQTQHIQQARANPELRASKNQGKPPIAATAKPADFRSGVVPAKQAGGKYQAPPANTARKGTGNEARTNTNGHASDLQPHNSTLPNSGNPATDKRYQQQQDQLAAKQNQEHQKLLQQQEKEHQKAEKKTANDVQKQQMEQRHLQQTQQLEQQHAVEQQKLQQHQQPKPSAPKPEEKRPPEKRPQ